MQSSTLPSLYIRAASLRRTGEGETGREGHRKGYDHLAKGGASEVRRRPTSKHQINHLRTAGSSISPGGPEKTGTTPSALSESLTILQDPTSSQAAPTQVSATAAKIYYPGHHLKLRKGRSFPVSMFLPDLSYHSGQRQLLEVRSLRNLFEF